MNLRWVSIFSSVAAFSLAACGPLGLDVPPASPLVESPPPDLNPESLVNRSVEDALMVVFRGDLNSADWKQVFQDSRDLAFFRRGMANANRQVIRLEESGEAPAELEWWRNQRDELVAKVGEAIQRVYERAAYLAVWDASLHCRFARSGLGIQLGCDRTEETRANPLAGGVPFAVTPVLVTDQRVADRSTRSAYTFRITLPDLTPEERSRTLPDFGAFQLQLSLRPTPVPNELTGMIQIEKGSRFIKDGVLVPGGGRGYVELRLSPL